MSKNSIIVATLHVDKYSLTLISLNFIWYLKIRFVPHRKQNYIYIKMTIYQNEDIKII
jgi:hypothetical protein